MRIKYILHISGIDYELHEDDLANWDEISCSYKREDYGGVVRSFTSKFEFVNRAKELLMAEYLANRFAATAKLSILTQNDNFTFDEQFSCQLDFSTIEWEDYKLKLSSIDDSLAATIKAEKGTKYEFEVGKDIKSDAQMIFDRLPMKESATYEFTQGDDVGDAGALNVTIPNGKTPWMGVVNSEVAVNGLVYWKDDQTDEEDAYLLKAVNPVNITIRYKYKVRAYTCISGAKLVLKVRNDVSEQARPITDEKDDSGPNITGIGNPITDSNFMGYYPDLVTLYTYHKNPSYGEYAVVGEYVYRAGDIEDPESIYNTKIGWTETGVLASEEFGREYSGVKHVSLNTGDMLYIAGLLPNGTESAQMIFDKSEFKFEWMARGDKIAIPVMNPENVARTLLNKIADGKVNVEVECSGDSRMSQTYLMAAESIRGIDGAKLYTSFNDFCEWMSVVFGSVYSIGDPVPSKYKYIKECGLYDTRSGNITGDFVNTPYTGNVNIDRIAYIEIFGVFAYDAIDPDDTQSIEEGRHEYHRVFPGSEEYNGTDGHPRTDTLFRIKEIHATNLYWFPEVPANNDNLQYYAPMLFHFDADSIGKDTQTVRFFHRSSLFSADNGKRVFENVRDLKYSVDTSVIYSSVEIGYNKQDYNSVNGRDEFNFNNTYSTGCTASDKKLSLISKYRADSYGVEFAAQERGKDTTDSSGDKDVFFVYCVPDGSYVKPDTSTSISGVISTGVFNGRVSPMACINANAGLIGLQADDMKLTYASTTGNADAVVNYVAMTADITLGQSFATNGMIEFTTDQIEDVPVNQLTEVVNDGVIYQGYLKEVDIKFAREEAAKYKLIVKSIIL